MGSGERPVTAEASLRILMVVEATADARAVSTLVDRVLLEHETRPSWVDEGLLRERREASSAAALGLARAAR